MITRIEAYRYRCFERLDLTLDRFQVFVGPNGAGKTTLLDIPIVLGEMLHARSIEDAFFKPTLTRSRPRAEYAGDLIFKHEGGYFALAVEAVLPETITSDLLEKQIRRTKRPKVVEKLRQSPQHWLTRIRYEIQFELFNEALQISQEYLLLLSADESWKKKALRGMIGEWLQDRKSRIVPVIQRPRGGKVRFTPEVEVRAPRNEYGFPPTEPGFANVFADRSRYGAALWLRDLLTKEACAYQPSLTALRTAQPRVRSPQLTRDASTLAWLAHFLVTAGEAAPKTTHLRERQEASAFERWERFTRLALPNLTRVESFVREDDKHAYLRIHYNSGLVVPASGLSDGTLYILALTILPYLSAAPAFITQEEPENGIHPKGIELIVEALQSVDRSQLFISTHSPLVLTKCQPAQIVCLRLAENGSVVAVRGDKDPIFADWQASADLGTLLAAGVLG